MKRSEMVTRINAIIFWNRKTLSDKDLAEAILKEVEEAGMKPPDCNYHNSEYGIWDHWEEEK